jgi:hypothetical protein
MSEEQGLLYVRSWFEHRDHFGLMAGKYSAAEAEALKRIRDSAGYRGLGLTWPQFCKLHAGISRKTAEKLIHLFEAFGADYFHLAAIVHLPPAHYRAIASAVRQGAIEHAGERIAIARENAARLIQAVQAIRLERQQATEGVATLRGQLQEARHCLSGDGALERRLRRLLDQLDVLLGRILELNPALDEAGRAAVRAAVERISATLESLNLAGPPPSGLAERANTPPPL